MSECRSCHAPIVWAAWADTNKLVPLDPNPTLTGNVIRLATTNHAGLPVIARATAEHTGTRYSTHFATCPNAAEHRRPR